MVSRRVLVCGTGTEVGKTHVACCLLAELVRCGVGAVGCKPVESGLEEGVESDAARLAAAASGGPAEPLYGFREALSPHLAARRAGVAVDLEAVRGWVAGAGAEVDAGWVVVETAGGLHTPLGDGICNLDLLGALGPAAVVLVAADRLGVLHDVSAVRLGLVGAGLWAATVVALSAVEGADLSSGTNAGELRGLGVAPIVVEFPRAPGDGVRSVQAAERLWAALRVVAGRGD